MIQKKIYATPYIQILNVTISQSLCGSGSVEPTPEPVKVMNAVIDWGKEVW